MTEIGFHEKYYSKSYLSDIEFQAENDFIKKNTLNYAFN